MADDFDFDLFPSRPAQPAQPARPAPVAVSVEGTGPRQLNRSDAAVAEADNRLARRRRSR